MKTRYLVCGVLFFFFFSAGLVWQKSRASDHDDGETDTKSKTLNLTDLYVYQETPGSPNSLIFQMNSNPRSLPRQAYFFSTVATYEFHVSRVGNSATTLAQVPTGNNDVVFQFTFGGMDPVNFNQGVTFNYLVQGNLVGSASSVTTSYSDSLVGFLTSTPLVVGNYTFNFFAGPREDPFFFDVDRFFQVRYAFYNYGIGLSASAFTTYLPKTCGGNTPISGSSLNLFNEPACAPDFTKGMNVNSIVLQVPIGALQSSANETGFDVWAVVNYPPT